MNDYFLILFFLSILRIPSKITEFIDKIDEKEKHIRKAFGMSYIQYFNLNKQFHKTVAELKSG